MEDIDGTAIILVIMLTALAIIEYYYKFETSYTFLGKKPKLWKFWWWPAVILDSACLTIAWLITKVISSPFRLASAFILRKKITK